MPKTAKTAIFKGGLLVFAGAGYLFAAFLISSDVFGQEAAPQALVECKECGICDLFKTAQNALNLIWWGLTLPLAALMFAYGGFLMMVPGAGGEKSAAMYTKGKKVLTNAVVGIAIIFFAWLGIDTIIKLVSSYEGSGAAETAYGPWNKIECVSGVGVAPPAPPPPVPPGPPTPTPPPTACSISPLSPITDPLAQQMEAGQTVIWSNTHPLLKCSAERLIQLSGGEIKSAYRPQSYQTHLWEIRDRWCAQGLRSNTNPSCSSLKSGVGAEVSKHFGDKWDCGEVAKEKSTHTSGIGVDITGADPKKAPQACLIFRNLKNDPWHYDLDTSCTSCP